MATFRDSLERTLRFEDATLSGELTSDTGGLTRFGISYNAHPRLYPEMATCSRARALEIAAEVYRREYWCFDGVKLQPIADKLFDMAVSMGLSTAVYLCQMAVGTSPDGTWGPRTEFAVNEAIGLLQTLRNASAEHYRSLATKNPERYGKYLDGWLTRAAS
jgi:lysozyme family protein